MIVEIFQRFLSGSGYKEIADHLNRPGGPPPPRHVDSKRNTSGKWSKSTIRSILENHVYTGRLYWNRLDFRAVKQGEGPLVRRSPEDWIEAEQRHEALVSEEDFERVQVEMKSRSTGQGGNRRRYTQKRFYQLRGIVHCATGHNPLRMQGKHRKSSTYYTYGYRLSYGDTAAEATGHGKWQYVREDSLLTLIDAFFATRVFGADRLVHFRRQSSTLGAELESKNGSERERAGSQLGEVDQRIERQLAAIEAGVDPVLVGERIRELKAERQEIEAAIAQLDRAQRDSEGFDVDEAAAILDSMPDLAKPLAEADPELRRSVFEAFRLRVEIDRNSGLVRLKALVSSAFSQVKDLSDVCSTKAIAGAGLERISATAYRLTASRILAT
jgi:Recombinase